MMKGVMGQQISYLTVIVVHSTMHLRHHNHCQVTTTIYMYIELEHFTTFHNSIVSKVHVCNLNNLSFCIAGATPLPTAWTELLTQVPVKDLTSTTGPTVFLCHTGDVCFLKWHKDIQTLYSLSLPIIYTHVHVHCFQCMCMLHVHSKHTYTPLSSFGKITFSVYIYKNIPNSARNLLLFTSL